MTTPINPIPELAQRILDFAKERKLRVTYLDDEGTQQTYGSPWAIQLTYIAAHKGRRPPAARLTLTAPNMSGELLSFLTPTYQITKLCYQTKQAITAGNVDARIVRAFGALSRAMERADNRSSFLPTNGHLPRALGTTTSLLQELEYKGADLRNLVDPIDPLLGGAKGKALMARHGLRLYRKLTEKSDNPLTERYVLLPKALGGRVLHNNGPHPGLRAYLYVALRREYGRVEYTSVQPIFPHGWGPDKGKRFQERYVALEELCHMQLSFEGNEPNFQEQFRDNVPTIALLLKALNRGQGRRAFDAEVAEAKSPALGPRRKGVHLDRNATRQKPNTENTTVAVTTRTDIVEVQGYHDTSTQLLPFGEK